jgi:hypothetical protein
MLSAFSKAARLKQWLGRPDCPQFLKECKVVFDAAFRKPSATSDVPNTSDIPDAAFAAVPADLRPILSDRRVALRARHHFNNVFFSRSSTHIGNSLILFHPQGDKSISPIPGSIQYIVIRQNKEVVYAVRRQEPAASDLHDPFCSYPHFPAKVYSPALAPHLQIVHPEWVYSHYARWKLDTNRVVVLTLSRASQDNSLVTAFIDVFYRIDD